MLTLKGYNDVKKSEFIELPNIFDLLHFPFCGVADFEDLYRFGNEDLRSIMNKIPLKNNNKYVTVNMTTQLLTPNVTPAPRGNWHFDTNSFKSSEETTIHLLMSESTALTDFMEEDLTLDQFNESSDVCDVEIFLNQNLHLIKPKTAESNKILTFNGGSHFHSANKAKRDELRFMIRVMESNTVQPVSMAEAITQMSFVYDDGISDYSTINREYIMNNKTKTYQSIIKNNDKIFLHIN